MLNALYSILSPDEDDEEEATPLGKVEKVNNRMVITCDGMVKTVKEWSKYLGIKRSTLYYRLRNGWSVEDALYKPVRRRTSSLSDLKNIFFEALTEDLIGSRQLPAVGASFISPPPSNHP